MKKLHVILAKKTLTHSSIFFLYKENNICAVNIIILLISNHDNENLTKNLSETKNNMYPAQKHIYVKP